ncbi:MAG: D-Ala-D-Ala carboxypeptidase family metallohydrolase, partial [Pseudomonadota bacterium]
MRIAQANGDGPVAAEPVAIAPQQAPVIASAANVAPAASNPNRLGLFNRFFNRERSTPQPPAAVPNTNLAPAPLPAAQPVAPTVAEPSSTTTATSIALASEPTETPAPPPPTVIAASTNGSSLPGVDRERLLGFGQADEPEPETRPIQVASAAGLARLAPNGLRVQHSGVDVACLKPALVRVLKKVERKFGKPVVVTSGYRSPSRNSNARGAKNSLHIYCAAADIQIEGVTKWELAS